MSETSLGQLASEIERLQAQIAELRSLVTAAGGPGVADAVPASAPAAPLRSPEPAHEQELSPEILLVISAAVAAYLGERAHIRAVRLISHTRWSQEGRVSIQASHHLSRG